MCAQRQRMAKLMKHINGKHDNSLTGNQYLDDLLVFIALIMLGYVMIKGTGG